MPLRRGCSTSVRSSQRSRVIECVAQQLGGSGYQILRDEIAGGSRSPDEEMLDVEMSGLEVLHILDIEMEVVD